MMHELIIDSFAGGGGASTGIEMALGRSPDFAINHDARALAMHRANHPGTHHVCKSIWDVDPRELTQGRPVGLAWFSPDCTHFSKARGGKPADKNIRDLAWVVIDYARKVRPRVICLENVEEFKTWGPLGPDNRPDKTRSGETFNLWLTELRRLGYTVEWRELRACDYGAPTIRKRFFLIARCDGQPIVWPTPTHGDPRKQTGLAPWRTAADIIDWSLPCPSIFERSRPLAEKTMARIFRGLKKFVLQAAEPFILTNTTGHAAHATDEPLATITTGGHHALVASHVTKFHANSTGSSCADPLHTITSGGKCKRQAGAPHAMGLVSATLVQTGYGEREGQQPRAPGLDKPLGTVVAGGQKHALIAAHLAKHYGGVIGSPLDGPLGTVTAVDHHSLVTSWMTKFRGTCAHGQRADEPLPTVTAGGLHLGAVSAFLTKYYATAVGQAVSDPLHTLTAKARLGLVTVRGEDYAIADIGMRMLAPRELYRAQGFPDSYVIELEVDGRPLSKADQVRMCGNSVCPQVAAALVRANYAEMALGLDQTCAKI